jgi:23S rRNA pseudouridine1911/1915/1917 synthase
LETGRTHQIRIHLKYINCPILGDEVYSGVKTILSYLPQNFHKKMKLLLKNHLKRQALHSYKLNFVHPITGENISVKSELPKDMKFVLEWIKKVEDEN